MNSNRNEAENENSSISNDDFSHGQNMVASMMHKDRHAWNNSLYRSLIPHSRDVMLL